MDATSRRRGGAVGGSVRKSGSVQTSQVSSGLGPGDMVAGRFRIRSFLGKGGFAEVFKADDTRFHRYVALKIPLEGLDQGGELWRLVEEVKRAQSVAHPNVIRIFELGSCTSETGSRKHFVASQMIEGDTLQTVLDRSLGGLTDDEKLNIAHDLCAGLEAIHQERIIHRDVKPENVMLTAEGRAIITDFGLATLAGAAADPRSGTLGYRAPELDRGEEPTVQSDLFALGVLLFELFTGGMPWPDAGARRQPEQELPEPEWPACRSAAGVTEPIQRCLRPNPDQRPASARQLAEMLPERPRPRAEQRWTVPVETLLIEPTHQVSRAACWWLLWAALGALALVVSLAAKYPLLGEVTAGNPPLVLEHSARDLLAELGFDADPRDHLRGYLPRSPVDLRQSSLPHVVFWYRQSPSVLAAGRSGSIFTRDDDPPATAPGDVTVQLDPNGRLLRLEAMAGAGTQLPGSAPDWRVLLSAAGLEMDRLIAVAPAAVPSFFADRQRAWVGEDPDHPDRQVRVEAAAHGSMPVYFDLSPEPPTSGGARAVAGTSGGDVTAGLVLLWIWTGVVIVGPLYLCQRHVRRRTADLRGATRLAGFVLAVRLLIWLLGGHHTAGPDLVAVLEAQLERGLHDALRAWILYVALEPLARRVWPWQVASWVRLLRARWRDPLLGRDLLVGSIFGLGLSLCGQLYAVVPGLIGLQAPRVDRVLAMTGLLDEDALARQCQAVLGFRESIGMCLYAMLHALTVAFIATVSVVFLKWLLRRSLWSRPAAVLLMSSVLFPAAGHPLADAAFVALIAALWITVLIRFGFLAATIAMIVAWWVNSHPLTFELDRWHASAAMVPIACVVAVIYWGFRAALGPRPAMPYDLETIIDTDPCHPVETDGAPAEQKAAGPAAIDQLPGAPLSAYRARRCAPRSDRSG